MALHDVSSRRSHRPFSSKGCIAARYFKSATPRLSDQVTKPPVCAEDNFREPAPKKDGSRR
eukprot:622324-Amphidinium_carterae.1